MGMEFYVYAWLRPCGTPFYIGKGKGSRDKFARRQNAIFNNVVEKIRNAGGEPRIVRLFEGLSEKEAFEAESRLIQQYGRLDLRTGVLANRTDGGEGQSGVIQTVSANDLRRKAMMGREFAPESIAKMSAYAANRSPEHLSRLGAAMAARSSDVYARIAAANTGKKRTAESCARIGASKRGRRLTEEHKAKIRAWAKNPSDKFIENLRRSQRLRGPTKGTYKGCRFDAERARFVATIKIDGKTCNLGRHRTEYEAALAYDRAAFAAWGTECFLNFGVPTDQVA